MSAPKFAAVFTSVVAATTVLVSPGATDADAAVTGSGSAQALRVDVSLADCTVIGTEFHDDLAGTPGDDVICGLGGDDSLYNSAGNDAYIGGDGFDWLWFWNATNGVKADLLTGVATGQGNDTIDGIENLYGSPYRDVLKGDSEKYLDPGGFLVGNTLTGGERGDVLGGRGGNDTLYGYGGKDTLIPGPGNDWASGDNGVDTISFKLSTGPVTVDMTTAPGAFGQGTDYVYGENVIGSAYDDTITGNAEGYGPNTHHANILWGLAGDDTLFGGPQGNDKLYGQAGNDALDGGTDTDLCDGGPDTDTATACETQVSIP